MANQYGQNAKIGYKRITSHGYVETKVGIKHHLSHVNGYAYEHRIVAEKKLGRRLRKNELVHHKDGDKRNNKKGNIEVVGGIAGHKACHRTSGKRRRYPGERNPFVNCACGCGNKLRRFDICGRARKFIIGHGKINTGRYYTKNEKVFCLCGCEQKFLKYDKSYRIRKFISGHNLRSIR